MNRNTLLVGTIAVALMFIFSCRKSDREKDDDTQSAIDGITAQNIYADVFKQMYNAAVAQPDLFKTTPSVNPLACPTISVVPALPVTGFPKTLTVDYGATNCPGTDGINRRGKIAASFTGKLRSANTVITMSFSNYYMNDVLIDGTYKITCLGKNSSNHTNYAVNVTNLAIANGSGKIYWSSTHKQEWLTGDTTATLTDDSFAITGYGSGTGVKGAAFETEIISAIKFDNSCKSISAGKFTLTPNTLTPRTIDFGSGACDDKVDYSFNGTTYSTTIK